ncbi:hypothetical protein ACQKQA_19380 [Pseudomonas sp. NPDC089530]|uniref:hypothetical protein n=1 Tax=Pseudomonas sp. NPDC089530 TaxID=3390651 RepID=UPI003D0006EC
MIKQKFAFILSLSTMVFLSDHSSAGSREEKLRLDAAYPVGSKIFCQSDLKDGVYEHFPMKLVMRGTVTAIQGDLTQYDISVDWIQKGADSASASLRYHMTNIREASGVRMHIDPASLKVFAPGTHLSEHELTKAVLARFASKNHFQSDRDVEVTDFPAYVITSDGESPLYCHKDE